jgi:hypothetical protein
MYNSYLGQQPQGQQGYQPPYQNPQQTGYVQPQPQFQQQQPPILQSQATGYLGTAGFQSQPQLQGQYGVPPVPAIPQQYASQVQVGMQPTGYQPPPQQQFQSMQQPQQQSMQQPPPPVVSAPTGHQRQTSTAAGTSTRIPSGLYPFFTTDIVRLTFLTTQDQIKFEQLFRSAVGSEQALEGQKARDILLRSKLSPGVLSQIWYVLI